MNIYINSIRLCSILIIMLKLMIQNVIIKYLKGVDGIFIINICGIF